MSDRPEFVESGEAARLIPVVADTNREQRTTSVVLAAMCGVYEFRRTVLGSIGRNISKQAQLHAWTEVALANGSREKEKNAKRDRPDGLLVYRRGNTTWRALVEAKVGNAEIDDQQLQGYLQQARQHKIDAVITITNQFVALPTHPPVNLSKRPPKDVGLYHWSWTYLLTQATLLLDGEEVENPDQRFVLEEVVRYLSHDSSGISRFDRMNREWKDVVTKIKANATLRQNSEEVEKTVSSWHQEQRDLSLLMSRKIGQNVALSLPLAHRQNPQKRLQNDSLKLVEHKKLTCTLRIPHAAADLEVAADLAKKTIICSMCLDAPTEKKTERARVNWLRNQLRNIEPDGFYIKATRPRKAENTQAPLAEVLESPNALSSNTTRVIPTRFEVFYIADLADRFSRNKVFVDMLEQTVPYFYEQAGQRLKAWVAPAPPIKDTDPVVSENAEKGEIPREDDEVNSRE